MRVVAIANRKGGTGKTTTVVNLANEWARKGYRTLVIDLDTQGHSAIGLGYKEVVAPEKTVHQLFRDSDVSLQDVVHSTEIQNIFLAPADTQFIVQAVDELCLRKALHTAANEALFDRVIIDTPPTLDGLLYNGLSAADGVIVPFVPHHLAEVGCKAVSAIILYSSNQA
ncbi:MAG: AAA family ATPase [Gammaproteobacteria bacterium]|nr:AAA family ATPase [Gammaproteobacteria bacterium]